MRRSRCRCSPPPPARAAAPLRRRSSARRRAASGRWSCVAVGDAAGEAPAAVRVAAGHGPAALRDFDRLAARARRGAGALDADADGESVAGQPLDLVPGALDDVLLARIV